MTSLIAIVALFIAALVVGTHVRRTRGAGYLLAAVLAAIQTALVLIALLTLPNPLER